MTAPRFPSGDLDWEVAALTGGIQQSLGQPTPTDLQDLENWTVFRGRFALRAPLTQTVQLVALTADENPPQAVDLVLAMKHHVGKLYVVAFRSGTVNKTYLYRLDVDGTAEDDALTEEPIATVWSSGTIPRVVMETFEGGSATSGVQRLYIADYSENFQTRFWDSSGSTINDVTEDLNDDGTKEQLKFPLVFAYNSHMFGTAFVQSGTLRKGALRVSQPGLIPALEPGVTNNVSREWWNSDILPVGSRGQKITCVSDAGAFKMLFKRNKTYSLNGFDLSSFTLNRVDETVGAVGPHAAAALPNGRCLFWSDRGPYLTDGQVIKFIGEPIKRYIAASSFHEDVSVAYSPDEGVCYVMLSDDGGFPRLHFAWDVLEERWVNRGVWVRPGTETELFLDTYTDSNGDIITLAHKADTPSASNIGYEQASGGSWSIATNKFQGSSGGTSPSYLRTDTDAPSLETVREWRWSSVEIIDWDNAGNGSYFDLCVRMNTKSINTESGIEYLAMRLGSSNQQLPTAMQVTAVRKADGDARAKWIFLSERVVVGTLTHAGTGPTGAEFEGDVHDYGMTFLTDRKVEFWREPSGGGTRTIIGTHTFDVSLKDASHRRCGYMITGGASSSTNIKVDKVRGHFVNPADLRALDLTAIPDDVLPGPTDPPSGLALTVLSDTSLRLTWANGDSTTSVQTNVYRSTSSSFTPSTANKVATLGSGIALYDDTGLTAETTYYYQLQHTRNGISSASSQERSAKTAVAKPTGEAATTLTNGVRVTVTNNSSSADLVIERKSPTSGWSTLTTLASQTTGVKTHDDTTATCGTLYTYRVKATKTGETASPYTTEVAATACQTALDITSVTHSITILADCPGAPNTVITWAGANFGPSDTAKIYVNDNGGGYTLEATVPLQDLVYSGYTYRRKSGVSSRTFQVRVEGYEGGVTLIDTQTSSQSNESVDSEQCTPF